MVVRIKPGKSFEVEDEVRHLRIEWVEGGSLLVAVRVKDEGLEQAIAIERRESRQLATFLAGG
jgi:hypothetical protein